MRTRQQLIAEELQKFMTAFPNAAAVAGNLPAALKQLTTNLGNVGIVYQQNEQSKANNPGVNGLQVGELLDMLHTLNQFAGNPSAFQADKFWKKLVTMYEVMSEDESSGSETGSGKSAR